MGLPSRAPTTSASADSEERGSSAEVFRLRVELERARRDRAESEANLRAGGLFFGYLVAIFAVYTLTLGLVRAADLAAPGLTALVSVPLQALFLGASADFVRRSGLRWRAFGVHAERAGAAIREALLFTLPVVGVVVLAKAAALQAGLLPPGPVIAFGSVLARFGGGALALAMIVYALFSVVQEIVARGVVQTGLSTFLPGPRREGVALVLSNVLFAVTHLHVSLVVTAGSFVVGLFWGWLFRRQRTVAGVAASHVLFGALCYFVIGVETR